MTQQNMEILDLTKGSFATIMSNIEERMANFEAELQRSMKSTSSSPTLVSLASDFTSFKSFVLNTVNAFKVQVETLAREVDSIEMRSRRKMLLIHGVSEEKSEDTAQVVANLCKGDLGLDDCTTDDIRRCHRMGRAAGAHKPRPILVKFECTTVRDKIWFSKTKLKGSGKTLSEFLTKGRHEVFMAARERFGVSKCWTREGRVFILDPDGKQHRITSLVELNRISSSSQKEIPASKPVAAKSKRAAASKK